MKSNRPMRVTNLPQHGEIRGYQKTNTEFQTQDELHQALPSPLECKVVSGQMNWSGEALCFTASKEMPFSVCLLFMFPVLHLEVLLEDVCGWGTSSCSGCEELAVRLHHPHTDLSIFLNAESGKRYFSVQLLGNVFISISMDCTPSSSLLSSFSNKGFLPCPSHASSAGAAMALRMLQGSAGAAISAGCMEPAAQCRAGGAAREAIISQHFISVLLYIHQARGFLRHIKGDSDVSHGEVTYFSRRRN